MVRSPFPFLECVISIFYVILSDMPFFSAHLKVYFKLNQALICGHVEKKIDLLALMVNLTKKAVLISWRALNNQNIMGGGGEGY